MMHFVMNNVRSDYRNQSNIYTLDRFFSTHLITNRNITSTYIISVPEQI